MKIKDEQLTLAMEEASTLASQTRVGPQSRTPPLPCPQNRPRQQLPEHEASIRDYTQ